MNCSVKFLSPIVIGGLFDPGSVVVATGVVGVVTLTDDDVVCEPEPHPAIRAIEAMVAAAANRRAQRGRFTARGSQRVGGPS